MVVNFSSGLGRSGAAEFAPYCATKWAIEGLTRALALELPRGMAAVPVVPGVVDTAMLRICYGARAGNFPDPAAWAEKAVPFLLGLGPKDNGKPREVPGYSRRLFARGARWVRRTVTKVLPNKT